MSKSDDKSRKALAATPTRFAYDVGFAKPPKVRPAVRKSTTVAAG